MLCFFFTTDLDLIEVSHNAVFSFETPDAFQNLFVFLCRLIFYEGNRLSSEVPVQTYAIQRSQGAIVKPIECPLWYLKTSPSVDTNGVHAIAAKPARSALVVTPASISPKD